MYEIEIKIDDIIANMNIEELEELKDILDKFKQIDEFSMRYINGHTQGNKQDNINTLEAYEIPVKQAKTR